MASAPVTPAAPAAVAEERIPFVLAAHGRAPINPRNFFPDVNLHVLDGALFLHAGGRVARLGLRGLSPVAAVEKAIPRELQVMNIFGVWPKSAFIELQTNPKALETEVKGALFRVTERGLSRVRPVSWEETYTGVWYGPHGRIGGVVYIGVDLSIQMRIDILDGPKGPVPEFSRRSDGQPRLAEYNTVSFPSGHLFLFGVEHNEQGSLLAAVERWEPGATRGTFERPPMPPGASGHLENGAMGAGSPTHVWIVGFASSADKKTPDKPYLARWDGARWSLLDMPAPSIGAYGAPEVAATADGHLWIGWEDTEAGGEITHRTPEGVFSHAALPTPPSPLSPGTYRLIELYAHNGELWLLTMAKDDHERFAVYRTRPPAGAVALEINAVPPTP
jgi:hypothetical protein